MSVQTMTTPTTHTRDPVAPKRRRRTTSISFARSVVDWWSSPSDLARAPSISSNSSVNSLAASRLRNRKIEYELYRAVFSDDIHIVPPEGGDSEIAIEDDVDSSKTDRSTSVIANAEFLDVDIGSGNSIHELFIQNLSQPTNNNEEPIDLVIIHGYMAASGYFLKNYETLVKSCPGIRIHAIDLLGFGNSSRPKFPEELLVTPVDHEDQIKQILDVESWFIDSIEQWRLKRNLRKFKLIGHSMGAYLLSCYLMKYNDQYGKTAEDRIVTQFVAVSPMGTEPNYQSLINDEKYQFNHHALGGDPFKELTAKQKKFKSNSMVDNDSETKFQLLWNDLGRPKFPKVLILRKLWEWNKSPFQLLQCFGPFYSKLLSYWSFQRFANLSSNDQISNDDNTDLILKLHYYSFSIFNQFQGSGELAITKLINHEILARMPLADRGLAEYLANANIKSLWMYGDNDWMNTNGGKYLYEKIKKIPGSETEFQIVEGAGHHIYLDNPQCFNTSCIDFFELSKK